MFAVSGPACSSVLAIPELLENILSFLPAKMVFRVQRVSQTWRSTIAQSVSIQEKLFFRCQSTPQDVWEFSSVKGEDDDDKFSYCEFKAWKHERVPPHSFYDHPGGSNYRYFPMSTPFDVDGRTVLRSVPVEYANHRVMLVDLNPTLEASVSSDDEVWTLQRRPFFEVSEQGTFVDLPVCSWLIDNIVLLQLVSYTGTVAALERVAAMYPCDPPCQKVAMGVNICYETIEGSPNPARVSEQLHYIYFKSSTGLKMGALLSAISHEHCAYYILHTQPPELVSENVDDSSRGRGDGSWGEDVTVFGLQSILENRFQRWHMRLSPTIKLYIRLYDVGDLRLIVPTDVEQSAVNDGWTAPASNFVRHHRRHETYEPVYDAFDFDMF